MGTESGSRVPANLEEAKCIIVQLSERVSELEQQLDAKQKTMEAGVRVAMGALHAMLEAG